MEIQIDRVTAPMYHYFFTEDRTKGSRVKMNKRTFKRLHRLNRAYEKTQKQILDILSASRV